MIDEIIELIKANPDLLDPLTKLAQSLLERQAAPATAEEATP